jgi:hypothetical protein
VNADNKNTAPMLIALLLLSLTHANLETLFKWCIKDEHCSQSYHITDMLQEADEAPDISVLEKCESVFVFFAEHWVHELRSPAIVHGFSDLRNIVEKRFHFRHNVGASADDIEHSVRLHWLLLLRLSAAENREVHCGTNERLVISAETMDAFCDCIPNRNCDDGGNVRSGMNLATLSTVSVSVLIVLYLIVSTINNANKIIVFHQYRAGQRSLEDARASLLKGE